MRPGTDAADEPTPVIDATLVEWLIRSQLPEWAGLEVRPVEPGGWDHRTFRLGDDMTVRLPSRTRYVAQVRKEQQWLPLLASHLPLPIPEPLAMGGPEHGYPWHWSVYRWIEGAAATREAIGDEAAFATALAGFLVALGAVDATNGPPAGAHNFHRGGPLTTYDDQTRRAIAALQERIDPDACLATWNAALAATWRGSPQWLHGDVVADNLIVRDGRLAAVIDFGCSGVGDPACDLTIAWTFLTGSSRARFRAAIAADDDAWARARGWALWKTLITLIEHGDTDPGRASAADRVIDDVLRETR